MQFKDTGEKNQCKALLPSLLTLTPQPMEGLSEMNLYIYSREVFLAMFLLQIEYIAEGTHVKGDHNLFTWNFIKFKSRYKHTWYKCDISDKDST